METQESIQPVKKDNRRRQLFVVVGLIAAICLAVYAYREYRILSIPTVSEAWASTGVEYANTDSVAAVRCSDGALNVLATAKWGDRIDVFDGASGRFIQSVGQSGEGPREFRRPNGIAIVRFAGGQDPSPAQDATSQSATIDQAILVVEREGARVQMLSADDYQCIGFVGEKVLKRPYGAALSYLEERPLLYVTDTDVPADKTVSVFRLALKSNLVEGTLVRQFGDAGDGRIHKAESIVVDDAFARVLLCDEDRSQRNVKVYNLDGSFTGRTFGDGIIGGDPEGLAIVAAAQGDFILVTDQRSKITIWHAFDRESLAHIASLTGEPRIANTDGIGLFVEPFGDFAAGAMFAVNDDADVRAYDLVSIINVVDQARSSR